MPTDMKNYPDNWDEIRTQVLLRAGGEWDDPRIGAECEFCFEKNYAVGWRGKDGEFHQPPNLKGARFVNHAEAAKAREHYNEWCNPDEKYIVIVLTIAHLDDPDPANCDLDNLAALCQRCHNRLDVPHRQRNRMRTKKAKLVAAGQMSLF